MIFSSLLRPVHDETFPSWMLRCALNKKILCFSDSAIRDWAAHDRHKRFHADGLGMEFDFSDSWGLVIAKDFKVSPLMIQRYFKPSSSLLLMPDYRTAYCHMCIQSDVSLKRYPSWRKSWCYVSHPYCSVHKRLLCFIDGCESGDKQWIAYAKGDLGEFITRKVRPYFRHNYGIPSGNIRAWLTLRVQHWVEQLHRMHQCALPGTNIIVDSATVISAVNMILRLFLVPKTDRSDCGIALDQFAAIYPPIVHKILSFRERLEYGAPRSVPFDRMNALLLLGLTFRIFSAKELQMFKDLVLGCEFMWPSLQDLGAFSLSEQFLKESEFRELLNCLAGVSTHLNEFITGLQLTVPDNPFFWPPE